MRRLAYPLILVLLLSTTPARAAEPPLALNAYVRGSDLVITVFVDNPTFVHVAVSVSPGWAIDQTDIRGRVESVQTTVLHITTAGAGLGVFRVLAADGRGNAARATAYATGAIKTAADPVGIRRRYLAIVRR